MKRLITPVTKKIFGFVVTRVSRLSRDSKEAIKFYWSDKLDKVRGRETI